MGFYLVKNQVLVKNAQYKLAELQAKLSSHKITIQSPFAVNGEAPRVKNYEAFALEDVLNLGFGSTTWRNEPYSGAIFVALDGYQSIGETAKLVLDGGYLAFKDLDNPAGWDLVGSKRANPGPYYLVWTGKDQTTAHAFPWPWQVTQIHLVEFEQHYPNVVPAGAKADSPARRGYQVFKAQCFRCHAMDKQGGTIGPDLGAPQVITEYRDAKFLKEYIRKPSQFRYTHMPDHEHLSKQDLDDLLRYFQQKTKEKKN